VFWNDSKTIKIRIIDNGVGISEEAQKKVFEMFYRAHENSIGTGLGLYICKEIINKLNGKITLHSKRNVGTEIEIIIPLK
jgi:signal transduction histidine kinase